MTFSQETLSHALPSSQYDFETDSKRDHGPCVCAEVCLCVHKMRLASYHILEKWGRVHKKGTVGGVEWMSNRHITPGGEHGQRSWGAARKKMKKKKTTKTPRQQTAHRVTQLKENSSLGLGLWLELEDLHTAVSAMNIHLVTSYTINVPWLI